MKRRISKKLSKSYFGPFTVLCCIGDLAYELDLPQNLRIHPVIHVSQLKDYQGNDPEAHFAPLPPDLSKTITSPEELETLEDETNTDELQKDDAATEREVE